MPVYDTKEEKIDYDKESKDALPLTKNLPMNFSIHKIGDKNILDPTIEEESTSEGRLVLAVVPGKPLGICSMQKGNDMDLTLKEFSSMLEIVEKKYDSFFKDVNKKIDDAIKNKAKK